MGYRKLFQSHLFILIKIRIGENKNAGSLSCLYITNAIKMQNNRQTKVLQTF